MPTYDYQCQKCGFEFEREQRITEDPIKTCPKCKSRRAKRLLSASGFILKGGGWYADGYGSNRPSSGASGESTSPSTSGASDSSSDSAGSGGASSSGDGSTGKGSTGKSDDKPKKTGSKQSAA